MGIGYRVKASCGYSSRKWPVVVLLLAFYNTGSKTRRVRITLDKGKTWEAIDEEPTSFSIYFFPLFK
ncbi:MAG: hypothetical protein IPL23_10640 [Saprospiraceae bacterium]|nr:hypothetical protein [Saprospiraceae bacterium]